MKSEYVIKVGEFYVTGFYQDAVNLERWASIDQPVLSYDMSTLRKCVEMLTLAKIAFTIFELTPSGVPVALPSLPPVPAKSDIKA